MATKEFGKVNEYLEPIITLELVNGAGMMLGAKLEIDYAALSVVIEKLLR